MSDSQVEDQLIFMGQEVKVIRKTRPKSRFGFIQGNRKSRILTLTMNIDCPMRVVANDRVTQKEILDFLESKKKWIEKNLQKINEVQARFIIPTLDEGQLFPFLGEMKYFKFSQTSLKKTFFKIEDGFLICYLPNNQNKDYLAESELKRKLVLFYKSEAERFLLKKINYWIVLTMLRPNKIVFRAPNKRWGSCNTKRTISLNWKLICQSEALIDYVIVHELCHLQEMNHSKRFWSLVETFLPNYQEYEKVLQDQEFLGSFLK